MNIEGIQVPLFVDKRLQRHFSPEYLAFFDAVQVSAFPFFALPPFQLPVSPSKQNEYAELKIRKKQVKAKACDSYLEFAVGETLRRRNGIPTGVVGKLKRINRLALPTR